MTKPRIIGSKLCGSVNNPAREKEVSQQRTVRVHTREPSHAALW
jgi:hypothetical protein